MIKVMSDLDLRAKRVLVRQDLNVPIKDGRVRSTARIDAALPTLKMLLHGARVAVMSHWVGRRKALANLEFSLDRLQNPYLKTGTGSALDNRLDRRVCAN